MRCDSCKEVEATIHLKQATDGVMREMHLCQDCATKIGFNLQAALSIPDLMMDLDPIKHEKAPDRLCGYCHMRSSDYQKGGRLGCARCYEAFSVEVGSVIAEMQKGVRHIGRRPLAEAQAEGVSALKDQLVQAVAQEDFELAADIRDRIGRLTGESGGSGAAR